MVDLAHLSITADSSDLKTAEANMRALEMQGKKTQTAATKTGAAIEQAGARARYSGSSYKVANQHVANLTAQFNDIGVMLAAGQSPLLLAAQQGTQITQVFQQMGLTGKGTFRALGTAFMSMISPVSLMTIGVIAGGAALAQWGMRALMAGRDTREFSEIVEGSEKAVNDAISAYKASSESIEDMNEKYGTFSAMVGRVNEILVEIESRQASRELAAVITNVERLGGSWLTHKDLDLARVFGLENLALDLMVIPDSLTEAERASVEMLDTWRKLAAAAADESASAQERLTSTEELLNVSRTLAQAVGGISKDEDEVLEALINQVRIHAELAALMNNEVSSVQNKREELEKIDEAYHKTLKSASQSLELRTAELKFGSDTLNLAVAEVEIRERAKGTSEEQIAVLQRLVAWEFLVREEIDAQNDARKAGIERQKEAVRQAEALAAMSLSRAEDIEIARTQLKYGSDSLEVVLARVDAESRAKNLSAEEAEIQRGLATEHFNVLQQIQAQNEARKAGIDAEKQAERDAADVQAEALRHARALQDVHTELVKVGLAERNAAEEAERWALRVRAAIDENAQGATEAIEAIDRIIERYRSLQTDDPVAGMRVGLDFIQNQIPSVATSVREATVRTFGEMETALVNFVSTGELSFRNLVNSILADLARIAIQQHLTGPLAAALSGAFGGFGGATAAAGAGGGGIAGGIASGAVPFAAAGGLVLGPGTTTSDSIPARLSRGEFVVNAASTRRHLPLLQSINGSSDAGASRGGTVVNVYDQRRSRDAEEIEIQRRETGDGREELSILIHETVRDGISSGEYDSANATRYGQLPRLR